MEFFKAVSNTLPLAKNITCLFCRNAHEIQGKGSIQNIDFHMVAWNLKFFHNQFFLKAFVAGMGAHQIRWKPCKSLCSFMVGPLEYTRNFKWKFIATVAENASLCFACKKIPPALASDLWICTVLKVVIVIKIKNCKIFFILIGINQLFVFNITVHVTVPVLVIRNNFCNDGNLWFQCLSSAQVRQLPA